LASDQLLSPDQQLDISFHPDLIMPSCTPLVPLPPNQRSPPPRHPVPPQTISAHPECKVKLTVLEETSTKGHKFRLSSFAVHKRDKVLQYAYAPVYDRRRRAQ
jgi:hypothetical protein